MNFLYIAMLVINHVRHVGNSCNHVHIELTIKAFLHNLHVQESEKATTETEAKRYRRLGRERERSVIKLQLLKRST